MKINVDAVVSGNGVSIAFVSRDHLRKLLLISSMLARQMTPLEAEAQTLKRSTTYEKKISWKKVI